jgi:hypothetical protein
MTKLIVAFRSFSKSNIKGKLSLYMPGQAPRFQEAEAPIYSDDRHMKVVTLPSLHTGHLYSSEYILVTNFCERMSRSQEGLSQ